MVLANDGGIVRTGMFVFDVVGGIAARVALMLASTVDSMFGVSVGNAAAMAASTVSGIFGVDI